MPRDLATPTVPDVVARALLRATRDYGAALSLPMGSYPQRAQRGDRLAVLSDRRARWWGVLLRWVFSPDCDLPWIFGAAVIDARKADESAARFWRETAEDWRTEQAARLANHPIATRRAS